MPWLLAGNVQLMAHPHFLELGEIQWQELLQHWSFYLNHVGLRETF